MTQWREIKLRNGEPLQAEQLIPAGVPASDDALGLLLAHSNRVESAMKAVGELLPSRKQLFQSGIMAAPMKLESWEGGEGNIRRWSDVLDGLSEDTNLWATLHSALEKPGFKFGTLYTNGFEELKTLELVPLKRCANFLQIHSLADLKAANTDRALLALLDLLEVCRRVEKEPLLIQQLVRLACLEMAYSCTWAGISSGQWKEPELFKLNGAWSQLNAVQAMERAVLMERAMFITQYHLLLSDRQRLIKHLDQMGEFESFLGLETDGAPVAARWARSMQATAWMGVWHSQDCVLALKRWDSIVSAVRSASTTSWLSIETNLPPDLREPSDHWIGMGMTPPMRGWTRFRFPISSGAGFLHGSVIRRALHGDCLREFVLAGIAIHRSLRAGNPLPERIESLVPRWLPS
ncbi:MAG: hypothetical protein FJ405_15190, partial [Verrucomicrobia bacterium]|nr:hypothetical protein [Verrucomicrobiota bacterium]